MVEGKPVPLPVNLDSPDALFKSREAKDISAELINEHRLNNKLALPDLIECSNPVLRKAAEIIYKKSVTSRPPFPVYTTRGSSYFNDKYQGPPQVVTPPSFQNFLTIRLLKS